MKYIRYSDRHRKQKRLMATFAIAVILMMAMVGWFMVGRRPYTPFSPAIAKKISFIVYYPDKSWQSSDAQATYANGTIFFAAAKDDVNLSLNEQATPQIFNDVPQYYPTLLTRLKEYTNFGTANGIAYLTRPAELKGGQMAVLNNNGTLVFVRPNHDLTSDQWRRFFNTLQVVK